MTKEKYLLRKTIDYNKVNQGGRVTPPAFMELLEETAIEHCRFIGQDVFSLVEKGQGWILRSGHIEIIKPPLYGEEVSIETWISHWSVFKGIREFLLYDRDFNIVGRASTQWGYMDIVKRRPHPIPEVFKQYWDFDEKRAIDCSFPKKAIVIEKPSNSHDFLVRRRDIDSNNHVHNGRYLEWVLESVPHDLYNNYFLSRIEGSFIHEVRYPDPVTVETFRIKENMLIHNVVNPLTREVLSSGRSWWTPLF